MIKKLPLIALLTFVMGVVVSYGWSSRKGIEDFLVETLSPEPEGQKFVGLLDACGPRFNSQGEPLKRSVRQLSLRTTGRK